MYEDPSAVLPNIADDISREYSNFQNKINLINAKSPILGNIAKESPEYIDQMVGDINAGRVGDIGSYVKSLIMQDNRFSTPMRLPEGTDITSAFSTIKGRHLGGDSGHYYMNLGSGNTGEYGRFGRIYQGLPNLTGDVST